MGSCMVKKFTQFVDLTDAEKAALHRMEEEEEHYQAGQQIIRKGDKAEAIYVISEGWCCLSVQLDKDVRSIFDIRIDGDISGISELSFDRHLYDLFAITDVTVCPFPQQNLQDIFETSPRMANIFYHILSREQSLLYERIASLGRRTALEKVAHFIIEVSLRMALICNETKKRFSFPIRQEGVADILGLSVVHVNRSLNELKRHGYIEYNRSSLAILDPERLLNLANFNSMFLQPPVRLLNSLSREA